MKRIVLIIFFFIPFILSAQTYTELFDKALDEIHNDSLKEAEVLLKQALKLEPNNKRNALVFSNLGYILHRLGDNEQALDAYSQALEIVPQLESTHLDRAAIFMEEGITDKAFVDYCDVLTKDKKNTEALLIRAYIYVLRRDYTEAHEDYSALLTLKPDSYSGRLGLVSLYQKEGNYKEALLLSNKMILEYPDDADLLIARAGIEREMRHEDMALLDLDQAISLNDSLPNAYILRGEILLNRHRKVLAKEDFIKAVSLGVPLSEVHDQLIRCK
ncbi:MAG: tetratricopeptide repeat protein [Bacteroidaceae bacterium]